MARIQLEPKQERIVRTLEGPLFVSAGAGSGKTFTLTQRIMHALRPGSKPRELWRDPNRPEPFLESIDQVLAITFTEKAAAELKQRIRSALIDEGMEVEAEKVDDAWISTIHGMCSRIIRAHALDVGVDPAFTVVGYADDLKRLAVEHVVRRVAADDAQGNGTFSEILDAFALEGAGGPSQGLDSLFSILVAILGEGLCNGGRPFRVPRDRSCAVAAFHPRGIPCHCRDPLVCKCFCRARRARCGQRLPCVSSHLRRPARLL